MSEQLKPCPFCRGEAELLEIPYGGLQAIRCKECGVTIRSAPSISLAIKAWNRRASEWVKTSEKLPKPADAILLYHKEYDDILIGGIAFGFENGKKIDCWHIDFKTGDTGVVRLKDCPYWMPLPKPPEVDE